jgi:hypothetical protein
MKIQLSSGGNRNRVETKWLKLEYVKYVILFPGHSLQLRFGTSMSHVGRECGSNLNVEFNFSSSQEWSFWHWSF